MTEATPRPWGYVHHKGLDQHLVGATLENVAIVEDRHGNAKENSEFIVKAVNSHDALVAAIEKLYSYIDYGKFANERTDDADFVDAVLGQVK